MKLDDVRLYLEASEAAKEFVGRYFDKELYFDYTHLVCRTALDGNMTFYRASYASTIFAVIVCLSVRPSVCHKSEFYKDG